MSQFMINDESISSFFNNNQMVVRGEIKPFFDIVGSESIYLKKECGITTEKTAVFAFFDKPRYSNTRLQNIYTYRILPYDSISIKLELVSFDVRIVEVIPK